MLRPLKAEIDAIASLLEAGAEDSRSLAEGVIKRVEELRGERKVYGVLFEMTPGVYVAYGAYATDAAARKAIPKIPMAQFCKRGAVSTMYGETRIAAELAAADRPPTPSGDFALVREDALAFKRGWKGNVRDRDQYLQSS